MVAVKSAAESMDIVSVVCPALIVIGHKPEAGNDAVEAMASIKLANPDCKAPIIVVASRPEPAFERECLASGAVTCLHAPVTFENFYRVIQVAIEPIPRMTIRISTNLPAAVNGKRTDESIQDLSENGAYILTGDLQPLNTRIPVRIKLADCVVSADARVIYAKKSLSDTARSGMGLFFERISEEDQKRIRLFIRSEISKDLQLLQPER